MRGIIAVLLIALLIGCTSAPVATPTPTALPTATPAATPAPSATARPSATPLPETHACYVETDQSLQNAIAIKDCFMATGDYVECVYFMLKGAQLAEQTETLNAGWAMRLYSKSIDCAKAAEAMPQASLLPEKLSAKLTNYFDCYNTDAVCGTTTQQIGQMLEEIKPVRGEFL
jgi:hypothetical protein